MNGFHQLLVQLRIMHFNSKIISFIIKILHKMNFCLRFCCYQRITYPRKCPCFNNLVSLQIYLDTSPRSLLYSFRLTWLGITNTSGYQMKRFSVCYLGAVSFGLVSVGWSVVCSEPNDVDSRRVDADVSCITPTSARARRYFHFPCICTNFCVIETGSVVFLDK